MWGSINENPIVKIARGTLEKYVDAVYMTSEVVGAAAGTNKLSGNWVWNEVEKKAEWVARQFNIPGSGLHIWPNYGGQGERGVWQLEPPAGSFTVSAQPAYLPGGETMMPVLPSARDTESAYALRTPKEGGDEWWWWGSYGWRDPHSGQGFLFNTKDGGPQHWKILHETPNQTVIGPFGPAVLLHGGQALAAAAAGDLELPGPGEDWGPLSGRPVQGLPLVHEQRGAEAQYL